MDPTMLEAWSGHTDGREMIVAKVRVYGADMHLKRRIVAMGSSDYISTAITTDE
jgi:hypothetical protein